jgi:hypothetical protein
METPIMLGLNWPWWFRAIDRALTALLTIVALCVAIPFYRRLDRIRRDLDEDGFARDGKPQRFLEEVNPAAPNRGMADTLDEAKAEFKARYMQVKGGM